MTIETIERELCEQVWAEIQLVADGVDRFRVFTPFFFDDGDCLTIVLKKDGRGWVLSDEAHTYMYLTYDIDEQELHKGTRRRIISSALSMFGVEDRNGELVLEIPNGRFGDSLLAFAQALLRIADVSFLTFGRRFSTFMDDFHSLLRESVPDDRRSADWHHPDHDSHGLYTVDCRIEGEPCPVFVQAIYDDAEARDATIALLQFERWDLEFRSLAIFEDRGSIDRDVLARFGAVGGKQFPSLAGNKDSIARYLRRVSGN